jgi:hypothetical protein
MTMQLPVIKRASGVVSTTVVAILALAACGSDRERAAEQPPSTPIQTPVGTPLTDPPTTAPHPETVPQSSPPPTVADDEMYEAITAVIEDSDGPRLCFEVLESLPPQCGNGVALVDWSWDAIDVERVQDRTTWVDQIYLTGKYDAAAQTFTVHETRLPSDADRERLLLSRPMPDFTVPCPPPAGGWPGPTHEWPGDEIAALDGYAGAWIDEAGPVWTVKFTGDLDAAEAAIREHYTDALCVVGASHSAAELSAIADQLHSLSSVQVLSTAAYVDASGEWIEAGVIAPDPERQSAFDAEFGPGVVRMVPLLTPVTST